MRKIQDILFSNSEHDIILIQPNFLMKILEEEQNNIVRAYWKSLKNQEPLGDDVYTKCKNEHNYPDTNNNLR